MSIEENIERIANALDALVASQIGAQTSKAPKEVFVPVVGAERTATEVKEALGEGKPTPKAKSRKPRICDLTETELREEQMKLTEEHKAQGVYQSGEPEAPEDDWGTELAEEQTTVTGTHTHDHPDEKAKAKALELAKKGFSEVKENFYSLLNAIRDIDNTKERAREIGYAILEEQIGTKALTEVTLPSSKFFEFTYAVEVARGKYIKSK